MTGMSDWQYVAIASLSLLVLVGLLPAAVSIVIGRGKSLTPGARWRYVILGGGGGFASGAAFAAVLYVSELHWIAIPVAAGLGLFGAFLQGTTVYLPLWASATLRESLPGAGCAADKEEEQ
jgi:hypothetical protein